MKETYRSENDFLLSAVRHGDQKAFDTLFRKYYPMLCAYGHRFVDLEDAEEIVEDSLLWIWENRETLVIESSLSSYLFKMVYRRASVAGGTINSANGVPQGFKQTRAYRRHPTG